MERRRSLFSTLLLVIFVFVYVASALNLPSSIFLGGLILIVAVVVFIYVNQQRASRVPGAPRAPRVPREYGTSPPRQEEAFRLPERPKIGRWVAIPIILGLVIGFILFENWWLNVQILTTLYLHKAALDWWGLTYLNNTYFYAVLAIGALVALSDPRLIIQKTPDGKRKYYLHSKLWGLINAIRGQIYEFQTFSPFPTPSTLGQAYDQIPIKRGILWKLVEFAGGSLLIAPSVAKDWAFRYLLISKWAETQSLSWFGVIQQALGLWYSRLVLAQTPTGTWLIDNSPIFEFLYWLRIPILIFGVIWGIRLFISFVLHIRAGSAVRAFRDIIVIGLIALTYVLVATPTQAFDVTTPYYLRTLVIGWAILLVLSTFLSLREPWIQPVLGGIFRRKIVLTIIVLIVSFSLLYGPVTVAVQINPALGGNYVNYVWNPLYLPDIAYTQWATGVNSIKSYDINAAINTGTNLDILGKIRLFNDVSAKTRLTPSIGVNWMDFPTKVAPLPAVDITNINGKEYWVAPLTIVMPPGGTAEDQWRSSRLFITHSERVLAMDAATGQIVPIESIFNLTKPYSIYYGEGSLFASSPAVYVDIPNFQETHLSTYSGPAAYNGTADYVLSGFDRFWYFSGLSGKEQLRTDFAFGNYGDVKMLYTRDINQRLSQILLPGMTVDSDPYIVSDGTNIYYSLYIYINRPMPTQYLDYPNHQDNFLRLFATVLINTYDGSIQGYLIPQVDNNYVSEFYQTMYPQWDQPIPNWLQPLLRYPEDLLNAQINAYDTYHVLDPNTWQKGTDFLELTTNSAGSPIEDVRYVNFYINSTTYWAGVRLVQYASTPGLNLAGMYVAFNGANIGSVSILRTGSVAVIGPQTALDSVSNNPSTAQLLTLHSSSGSPWQSGNILLYVINNRPYYFIPYYGGTTTTLSPAMIAIVDAMSQKVGYYQITNPQNSTEVGSASQIAYQNLVGSTVITPPVSQTAEARKQKVINEFSRQGYTVVNLTQLNTQYFPSVQNASVSYLSDADWTATNSTISSFIKNWVEPNKIQIQSTVLRWDTVASSINYLNLGVFVNQAGTSVLHYITLAYG